MNKDIDVCGIGNAIVDVLTEVPESFMAAHSLEKGSFTLVEPEMQESLLTAAGVDSPALVSGGSVANSIISLAQLGGRGGLLAVTGNDAYGAHYRKECEHLGVRCSAGTVRTGRTGACLIFITPDAERTMRTSLGVSSLLSDQHIDKDLIARSKWIFVEGYLFSNPDLGIGAIDRAISLAKSLGTKVALTLSASWVIATQREHVERVVEDVDLLFANDDEAIALTGAASLEDAIRILTEKSANSTHEWIVTAGAGGAYRIAGGTAEHTPAFPCKPVDMTGAGDMLAGAYLYGITDGEEPMKALSKACLLASKVIEQVGARYRGNAAVAWRS